MATHVVLLARVGEEVGLAVGHLIVRTIYTPSKLKSMRIMRDNSGICELLDLAIESVTQRKVYSVADWFLKEKVKIEKSLCQTTDDLFKPTNRIMISVRRDLEAKSCIISPNMPKLIQVRPPRSCKV